MAPSGWTNSRAISWTYGDSSGHAQTTWEAKVATDAGLANVLANGTWSGSGTATASSIPGNVALTDGTQYYWGVRVNDGTSWSAWTSTAFRMDTAGPSGSVSINAGAAWTTAIGVTLALTATDAGSGLVDMRVGTANPPTGSWESFSASRAFTLPAGEGATTVYVEYRDAVGNTTVVSDGIGLDTIDPAASLAINGGAATTATQAVVLNVTNGDATSGVASTTASNDGTTFSAVSGAAPAWTLTAGDGTKTVWYRVTDAAGRVTTVSDTIVLATDLVPPDAPSLPDLVAGSDSGASDSDDVTSDATPTFTGSAEAGSTVLLYAGEDQVGTGTATGGTWTITATALPDSLHAITATATDASNNTSGASAALALTIDPALDPPDIGTPDEAAALTVTASPFEVAWMAADPSGIASQALEARDAEPIAGACAGVDWSAWGAPAAATSPATAPLTLGRCHSWRVTVGDVAGNTSSAVSGSVLLAEADVDVVLGTPATSVTPSLALWIASFAHQLHPGDEAELDVTLSYHEATLTIAGDLEAASASAQAATVEAATFVLEKRLAGQGTWIPVAALGTARPGWTPAAPAPTGLPSLGVAAPGVAASGVTYPAAFEPLIGTLIGPGATASWGAGGRRHARRPDDERPPRPGHGRRGAPRRPR